VFDFQGKELKFGKNCSWIISESHYNVVWGCRRCVGGLKTEVTNLLRKMFNTQDNRTHDCGQHKVR